MPLQISDHNGFLAVVMFFCTPVYVYFTEKQLVPLIPQYVPGIDERTAVGYVILMAYHLIEFTLGMAGFIAFEFLLEIIIISSLMFGKLVKNK